MISHTTITYKYGGIWIDTHVHVTGIGTGQLELKCVTYKSFVNSRCIISAELLHVATEVEPIPQTTIKN